MIVLAPGPCQDFEDEGVWTSTENGGCSLRLVLGAYRSQPSASWVDFLWFKGRIMKHSITTWFAIRNGLKTKELLRSRNVMVDLACILYAPTYEDCDHLHLLLFHQEYLGQYHL